jgi:Zn-dependent peptidase ImmA (M78 family)
MADAETVKELSQKLLDGVKETFESDNYKNYLKFVSSFHNYSLRNTILILTQRKNASQVAGFQSWKNHGRYVKRGEKGIAIFAPSKVKLKKPEPVFDEDGNQKLNPDGSPVTEEQENSFIKFMVTYVYDVSQTDGDPLPEICNELQGNVDDYEKIFAAVKNISPYKIDFEQINSGAKGYCDYKNSRIAIKMGMSNEQIIKTLIHEFAHATLHQHTEKSRERKEVEAESVAYIVSNFLGIDTSSYSFEYVANWSQGMELQELQNVLESIQSTANQIINSLQQEFQSIEKSEITQDEKNLNLQEKLCQAAEKSNQVNQDKEMSPFEKRISK